jgi:PAS domain S-box-containing protein
MSIHRQIGECFAQAATGFAMTDAQGNIVHANETLARIVDRSLADMGQANLFELIHPADRSQHEGFLARLLSGEIPGFVIEKRYVRPDGTPVWVRNSVSLAAGEQSDAPNVVSICEDIDRRKMAERVLEQQEQMAAIGRLTSSIVHEINNPLEAVLNLLFLARRSADPESAQRFMKDAEEELGRVSEITMQALQFHRQPTIPTLTSVVQILQSVMALFKGKVKMAGIRVEVKMEDEPKLMCFPGEVRQVFVNLISNAIESMSEGGVLWVRVRPATDWRTGQAGVRITIADTGHGMSAETRGQIYQAFYTTKGSSGSGLGLWVTANIVKKHNGSIHVRSRRVPHDGGTAFTLMFPVRGATDSNTDSQAA